MEDVRTEMGRDALSSVGNRQDNAITVSAGTDRNPAAFGCVAESIGEQVSENLLQTVWITLYRPCTGIGEHFDAHTLHLCAATDSVNGRGNQRREIDRTKLQVQLSGCDAGYIKELVHELNLQKCIPFNHLNRASTLLRIKSSQPQHPHPTEDGVKRRPQLMGEVSQKLIFGPVRTLGLGARRLFSSQQLGSFGFGTLLLGDVNARPDVAGESPIRIEPRYSSVEHPPVLTIDRK